MRGRLHAALIALSALGCGCSDDGGPDDLSCEREAQCGPDQSCESGTCTNNPCSSAADCGEDYEYLCDHELCAAVGCDPDQPVCSSGFLCTEAGTCQRICETDDDCNSTELPCMIGQCTEGFGCSYEIAAGQCMIDLACWAAGDLDPNDGCRRCDPAVDPLGWTAHDENGC